MVDGNSGEKLSGAMFGGQPSQRSKYPCPAPDPTSFDSQARPTPNLRFGRACESKKWRLGRGTSTGCTLLVRWVVGELRIYHSRRCRVGHIPTHPLFAHLSPYECCLFTQHFPYPPNLSHFSSQHSITQHPPAVTTTVISFGFLKLITIRLFD
jgi:hypothetical protein